MASPNPASIDVSISSDPNVAPANQHDFSEVRVYDQSGNLKKVKQYNKVKSGKINISDLNIGTYWIEIISGTYSEKKQLYIQH